MCHKGREVFAMMNSRENLETGFACLPKWPSITFPTISNDLFPSCAHEGAGAGAILSEAGQNSNSCHPRRALINALGLCVLYEPPEGIQPNV